MPGFQDRTKTICLYQNYSQHRKLTYWLQSAWCKRIPDIAFNTCAGRHVVHHTALCIHTARSRARVNTFVALTGLVGRTVRVDHALGPARDIRVAKIFGNTLACSGAVAVLTYGVGSAWGWVARVNWTRYGCRGWTKFSLFCVISKRLCINKMHFKMPKFS